MCGRRKFSDKETGVTSTPETLLIDDYEGTLATLQAAVASGDYEAYRRFAAIVNSPTYYDPFTDPQATLARRNLVLEKMASPDLQRLQ